MENSSGDISIEKPSMKIAIKTPCHENWDTMSSNKTGAFCSSCSKNVIDFSTNTIEEIKVFFKKLNDTEKICGRFQKKQMTEMSLIYFIDQFMFWKLVKKAAVICFLVFANTLFSGCSVDTEENQMMGEFIFVDTLASQPIEKR